MRHPSVKYEVSRSNARRSPSTDMDTDTEEFSAVDDSDESADADAPHSELNQQPLPTLTRAPLRRPSSRIIDSIKAPQRGQDLPDWIKYKKVLEGVAGEDDDYDDDFKTSQRGQDFLEWMQHRQLSSFPRLDCIYRMILTKKAKTLDAKDAEIAALQCQIAWLKVEKALVQAQNDEEDQRVAAHARFARMEEILEAGDPSDLDASLQGEGCWDADDESHDSLLMRDRF